MNVSPSSPLAGLINLQQYQLRSRPIFPGLQSVRWYVRQHRARLNAAGALLYIAGRVWIEPEKFDACVLAGGTRSKHGDAV